MPMRPRYYVVILQAALWCVVVVAGFAGWQTYDTTPGRTDASTRWQLTLYVHPKCPCTQASLEVFEAILASEPRIKGRVVFVYPPGADAGWERGNLWEQALELSDVVVAIDGDGKEARGVGARTSGHAELTNVEGRVIFRGGLTSSRGRVGTSLHAIPDMLNRSSDERIETPVFGCPLFDAESESP